jgi:hypothetical protein
LDYITWNDRVAAHFFKPESEAHRVFLYVTPEVLTEIAASDGAVADFVTAVKCGPPGTTRQGLCQRALQIFEHWRTRGGLFPPYVGYLAMFVLAAGIEGDFAPHAYYPRLRQLLGEEPIAGQYPSFPRMLELWDDLERWANEDQSGKLGVFKADIAGNWMYVGLPIAQTILTQHERESLHSIFADIGLEAGSAPTDAQLAQALLTYGQHRLRPRTLRLVESNGDRDSSLRDLLLETVLEELQEWDGYCVQEESSQQCVSGALRLCCHLDRVAARIRLTLRCKCSQELPEGGLALRSDLLGGNLICEEHGFGWSTEITDAGRLNAVDANGIDLTQGLLARTEDGAWLFRFPGSTLRIFEAGGNHGIPDLVECVRLPSQGTFYLLCSDRVAEEIHAWGQADCTKFEELVIDEGIPPGWKVFVGSEARNDERIRQAFPSLSLHEGVRLRCEGGIQHSRNRYFTFTPPRIWLDGADALTTVSANGTLLAENKDAAGLFELPVEIVRSGKLSIEAKRGNDVVARRSIYFSDDSLPTRFEALWCDRFGRCVEDNQSAKALVCGSSVRDVTPPFTAFFLPGLPATGRVILLGARPGQIVSLPTESLPTDWEPIWAVPIKRRGTALFCGTSISRAEPDQAEVGDERRVERWTEVLWRWRHRITPPHHRSLARLWARYQRRAREL